MATTAQLDGCHITVHLPIEFDNDSGASASDFDDVLLGWTTTIDEVWNDTYNGRPGNPRLRCCPVTFDIETREKQGVNGTPNFHQVKVKANGDLPGGAWTQIGTTGLTGSWEIGEDEHVAAHEAGHMFGLEDEYDDSSGVAVALHIEPRDGPLDLTVAQCIMAVTATTNVRMFPEHIKWMMAPELLDIACPWQCCVLRLPDGIREVIRFFRRPPPEFRQRGELPPEPPLPPLAYFELASSGTSRTRALIANFLAHEPLGDTRLLVHELRSAVVPRRWLAAIALGVSLGSGTDRALVAALDDPSVSVRVQAARSLGERGDDRGVPVLLDTLASNELLLRHPPCLARDYAHRVLRRISGEDFGYQPMAPAAQRKQAMQRWRAWWSHRSGR